MPHGSIIGESDATSSIGIDFFGDIYAGQEGLECLVIENPDIQLDEYEKKILKSVMGKEHSEMRNILETRFSQLRKHGLKNY